MQGVKSFCALITKCLLLTFLWPVMDAHGDLNFERAFQEDEGDRVVYIGVLANRGVELCLVEWGPTADYLSEQLPPYEFRILPFGFDEILDEVSRPDTRISFVSANSSYYAYMEYHGLARRIATLLVPGDPLPQSSFGGTIFTRSDRLDINNIKDLRNKSFAAVDSHSLGGWHAALREIHRAGLEPRKDFKSLSFAGTHDAVVHQVLSGIVDAGTVRSSQLERMAAEGLINLSDIQTIHNQQHLFPEYPYLLSTQLYPEWPFASITGIDAELSKRVALVLLMMDGDHPAAKSIRGAGWTIPEQYVSVHNLLRELLFPPYEGYGITVGAIIKEYWPWLLTMLLLFIASVVFGTIVFVLKIRAQKIAKQLKTSEKKFSNLFDNAPTSIMVMDQSTAQIIDANKKAIESYGLNTLQELQNADIWAEPPYSFNDALVWHDRLHKEGPQRFEWKSRTVQGKCFWEEVLIQEIDFGDQVRVVAISNDITERKIMEDALRKSEEMFRNLSKNLSVGVAMIGKDMKVLLVNPKMREWFPSENYNSCPQCYDVFNFSPRKGVCAGCPIVRTLADGKTHRFEREVDSPRGTRHYAITATAIKDMDGNPTAAIEMVDDITARKEGEITLQKMRLQAEEANKTKSEFLANMSHEIRTPLNGVIGFTELLRKSGLSELQKSFVDNVRNSAHALLDIINDILDLSKIEANKLELEIVKADIIDLAEQTVDIIKYSAAQKDIELLLNIDTAVPAFVEVDPVRLKQILLNLLSNSIKFTDRGEVELIVGFEAIDERKGKLRFGVRDTGIGISEENQSKIFDAFTQADSSTTRKYGGSGLGLTISALLAKKMNSRLFLTSMKDQGSEFSFSLETTYEAEKKLQPNDLGHIRKALMVVGNAKNSLILEHTLNNWGIECVACNNGIDAIKVLKEKQQFDVILIDFHIPGMNGLDTIRKITEELLISPKKKSFILIHNSIDDVELFRQSKALGVRLNISKPLKPRKLLESLKGLNPDQEVTKKEKHMVKTEDELLPDKNASPYILLVEDVEMNMLLIRTLIRKALPNARFVEAADGSEAIKAYKAKLPDLIFMDVQMPVMDGLEATAAIRDEEQKSRQHVPIVALTARSLKDEVAQFKEAGMDDFISKPIQPEDLKKVLIKYVLKLDND